MGLRIVCCKSQPLVGEDNDGSSLHHSTVLGFDCFYDNDHPFMHLNAEWNYFFLSCSKSVDPAHLRELLPNPTKQAASSPSGGGPPDGKTDLPHTPPLLVLPTLILPRVVPQLREMARRLVAAGYHQQCLKIYR
jgi:hypothetical protein